jgi:hypothetical protein
VPEVTGSDEEFEDFLKRRKPIFRASDDMFEPPAELDRIVLRRAREAIETDQPLRVFRGPRWATPVALAATLLLAFTVIFQAGMPAKRATVAEVTVQNVAQRVDVPAAPPPPMVANSAPAAAADTATAESSEPVVDLSLAPSKSMVARREMAAPAPQSAGAGAAYAKTAPAAAASVPAWRRDSKTWLAEIERLRNAGDAARANAELEEYKRQHRAYAGAPDQ